MMDITEDKSLCGLIKFHSARLAEVAKDTEELQASIDNEVAKAYQKGFEDGVTKRTDGDACTGCMYQDKTIEHHPCGVCCNAYHNQWTSKSDKIEVGDEVKWNSDLIVVTRLYEDGGFDWCDGIGNDGRAFHILEKNARKTDRHFNIEMILEAMKA